MKRLLVICFISFFIELFIILAGQCLGTQGVGASSNPFSGVDWYVNPAYVAEVQSSIDSNPNLAGLLSKAQHLPVFYWVDRMAKISNLSVVLSGALEQQKSTGNPTLVAFVVYDLPDRDCAAAASNGEISCADSDCVEGINTYKTQYIDPIVAVLKQYPNQPVVALIEPDSLGNLATNLGVPKCAQAQGAYVTCIAYAIQQLSALSNVALYLDAAHGGWLGWDNNRAAIVQVFANVLTLAGGQDSIRGFATNVANYQPLGSLDDTDDPCQLLKQYNKAINEAIYISLLSQSLESVGITGKAFITDTSRNGVINERQDCSNWCNIKGSGFGERPSDETSQTGLDIIDAFVWVKVPGESDGTSNSSSPRYDYHCTSVDSYVPAPEAGDWFSDFFVMLAQDAVPPLS